VKLGRSQNWKLRETQAARGEQAFALPLVIPAALLLILGAITLMSRTTSSYLAITKQSDAQAARQAAESGMNRVLSALNPMAKFSTDPYLSFLLASRWESGSDAKGTRYFVDVTGESVPRTGWRLTTLSRAQVQGLLNQCGLSIRGQHANSLPPANETGYQDILSGGIGPQGASTKTQLRYRVTDYVAPMLSPSDLAWPSECEDFTTLSGGSAQISVEGRVIRNGRLVSRYTLTRTIDVQGWPLPNLPASWMERGIYPGPPFGLRIGGRATNLRAVPGVISTGFFDNFQTSTAVTDASPLFRPQCRDCTAGAPSTGLLTFSPSTDIVPAGDVDLPRYPFTTSAPPSGLTPKQLNDSNPNYPYVSTGSATLVDECRRSESVNPGRPNEIDCWIQSVGIPANVAGIGYTKLGNVATITLDTIARYDVLPGNKIKVDIQNGQLKDFPLVGTVTGVSSSTPVQISFNPEAQPADNVNSYASPNATVSPADPITITVNTQARPVNLILLGDVGTSGSRVSIKSKVTDSRNFVHGLSANLRSSWNRLRLFGLMANGSACGSPSPSQLVYIRPSLVATADGEDASLAGTFVWLPRGELHYGNAGETSPTQLLSVWWVCNLSVANLTRPMMLISPLNGNHDAVGGLLTGGYYSAAGIFNPDLRFPVYPSLQRIRSAF